MRVWLYIAAASLTLLTACGEKSGESAPHAAQSGAAVEVHKEAIPENAEIVALNGCIGRAVTVDPPSLDALANLQSKMHCIENFLNTYKNTAHWQKAYDERARAIEDSMAVITGLSVSAPKESSGEIGAAQRALIDQEKFKKLKSENYYYVKRAMEEITISIHHALFRELRDSGVQMGNPQQKISEANQMAKQTGVWETKIGEASEDGQFVVTWWASDKSPMFLIEGYGPTAVILKIEDRYFDDNGVFSPGCKVYLGVTQKRLSYECQKYLAGNMGREVLEAMKSLIKEDMEKKAGKVS